MNQKIDIKGIGPLELNALMASAPEWSRNCIKIKVMGQRDPSLLTSFFLELGAGIASELLLNLIQRLRKRPATRGVKLVLKDGTQITVAGKQQAVPEDLLLFLMEKDRLASIEIK